MITDYKIVEEPKKPMAMHPKKFLLWLFMISIAMIFAALTSGYIVRQSEGNWVLFELPVEMWYTSGIILLSSFTMHWAYLQARKDNLGNLKVGLVLTTVLGIMFLVGQFYVWGVLVENNIHFVGNPSGSFLYVLSGVHGVHIISGLIFLVIVLVSAFKYKVHAKRLTRLQMCMTYWHFLDALWIYLFVFLLLNH